MGRRRLCERGKENERGRKKRGGEGEGVRHMTFGLGCEYPASKTKVIPKRSDGDDDDDDDDGRSWRELGRASGSGVYSVRRRRQMEVLAGAFRTEEARERSRRGRQRKVCPMKRRSEGHTHTHGATAPVDRTARPHRKEGGTGSAQVEGDETSKGPASEEEEEQCVCVCARARV